MGQSSLSKKKKLKPKALHELLKSYRILNERASFDVLKEIVNKCESFGDRV